MCPRLVTSWRHPVATCLLLALIVSMEPLRGQDSLPVTNLTQLTRLASPNPGVSHPLLLEAQVWWANDTDGQFVLKDGTGAELLEMDLGNQKLRAGQLVRLQGNATIGNRGHSIRIGAKGPLVDSDGLHSMVEKFASVYLKAGRQPLRLEWFNGTEKSGLTVEYSGPDLPRQPIPDSALFRAVKDLSSGAATWTNGLDYRCCEVLGEKLPDFKPLTPIKTGVCSNFDPKLVTRPEHIGLQFTGFLEIPRDGLYTFFIKSDDGSRLYMGAPSASVQILGEVDLPSPSAIVIGQRLAHSDSNRWVQIEGKVTFARKEANGARLELGADSANLRVHIADDSARDVRELFNCRIRATGFCQPATTADGDPVPGLLLVPSWRQIELIKMPPRVPSLASVSNALPVLTAAVEVHRLKREEAERGYPVSIRGVVTSVLPEHQAFTFQDSTRGLYVIDFTSSLAAPPQPGDLLEVEGTTDPGLFAPVVNASHLAILGLGKLPQPLRPAWDQLMNGSMDAQLVELAGVVTTVEGDRMTLLTSDGIIQVVLRLNGEPGIDELRQFEDAQVRLRGCLFASWDFVTHQVRMGDVRLYGADIFVDQPAPVDVFSMPAKSAAELRLFDPQAGAYQRVKVSGQIVFCRKDEYFMMQGGTGLRFVAKKPANLESGDTVEVVGFPDWTSVFPVLREAAARKTGHAALPPAARLTSQDLTQSARDATRVTLSATLAGVRLTRAAQILELQDGARAFTARLDAANETSVSMPPGSRLQLTGVYAAQGGNRTVGQDITSFELLMNSPADIQILARPPWWTLQRLLVALGVLAGVLALSFLWITQLHRKVDQRTVELATQIQERQRAEQQRSTEQERARVAQDLHDELGSGLTEVSMLVARARQDNASPDKRDGYLEQMGQRAKEMVIALDEIVWAMNPRHDSLGSLVSYLSIYAERFLSLANISWRLAAPPGPADVSVDSRCRHQLFLAFKEALTNVVRHSGATEVELKIEIKKGHVQLTISDNGRGLAGRSHTEEMDGVGNMRARLERVGGMFQLASRAESGTTLSLSVPARCEGI